MSAVLSGYSREELGFNPTSIPAWLQTTLDSSALRDQIGGGTVMLELGALIDGVSDIGFRNMLTGAKRDFPVKLPPNEVFHALTTAEAPGAPGPSALPAMVAAPKPVGSTMVIQPSPAAAPMEPPPPAPAPVSAFAPPVSHPAPVSTPPPLQPPASTAPPAFNPFPSAPSESRALFEARQQAPQPAPAQETGMEGLFTPPTATKQLQPAPPEPAAPASGLLQPKPGVFSAFSSAPAAPAPHVFDPFGSTAPSAAPAGEAGFTSAQLLGQQAAPASTTLLPAPHARPLSDPFAKPVVAPAAPAQPFIPENPAPSNFFASPSQQAASRPLAPVAETPTRPAFGSATVPLASPKTAPPAFPPAPEARPAAAPASAAQPAPATPPATSPIRHSFLGLNPLDTQTDQLLLRALLGTEASLDASSVVRLLATQPGLSACVCLHGSSVLSHGDPAQPDAATFQQQAADIARQVRGLAPLIGITEAETFTLNAGGRLITFCFPGSITLGVLHAGEPSNGLRDKITLVARELARMLG
ncbi:MAG: hypothetical protein HS117_18810 [Verrucomicrobiaceae bacterium]|nr:hypothetical protein [Verrucomicrobiaceae bacterium]